VAGLNLNINGDARRAQQALNDVATGSQRAARITDQLSRSYDHLEREATQAQRRVDELNEEIANSGPTAELNAELAQLQQRLANIGDERQGIQSLQGQFRRSTAAAAQLDNQLANVRRELDQLNDEYSRSGDPAVLRRIQEQQREEQRLAGIRRRIADEDENNQRRLARVAAEADRARRIREDEERRRREQDERNSRGILGNAAHDAFRLARRGASAVGDRFSNAADNVSKGDIYSKAAMLGAAIPVATTALAAAGGAVLGAGAIAAVGIGIKGAIDGPSGELIKTEFGALVEGLQGRLAASTADWSGPLVEAAHTFGDALDEIPMERIFADAKEFIGPLSEGFAGLAKGAGKGFAALVREGEPVVKRLGKEFGELGDDIEESLSAISMGAQGGADALGDILDLTGALIRGFGKMVLGAEAIYETLENAPVTGWFHDMWSEWLESDAPEAVPAFAADLDGVAQSANGVAQGGDNIASAWVDAETAMNKAAETADRLFDAQTGAVDAAVAWEQSIDDLTDSIKENGQNWDITTQKGRDNTSALLESIEAAKATREANIANGMSVAEANRQYEAQIAFLRSVATNAGLTGKKFDEMTAALLNYINAPQNKTITTRFIDIHYVSTEGRIGDGTDPRTQTGKAYASGGTVSETGFSLVGENGPELRWLNQGDYIMDAQKTARALTGGYGSAAPGSGGGLTMRVVADANNWLGQAISAGLQAGQIQIFDSTGQPVTAR
jgi:hypothetical protein